MGQLQKEKKLTSAEKMRKYRANKEKRELEDQKQKEKVKNKIRLKKINCLKKKKISQRAEQSMQTKIQRK